MVGHGRSSAGSYLADPTSPIPSHCCNYPVSKCPSASIVVTSTLRVNLHYHPHQMHCQGHSILSYNNVWFQWSVTESPPSQLNDSSLTIGFLCNRETCNSIIDKGPAAETPEVIMVVLTARF